jgi:hypothetical protein
MKKRRQWLRGAEPGEHSTDLQSGRWIDGELARCKFKDARHGKRLRKLLEEDLPLIIPI